MPDLTSEVQTSLVVVGEDLPSSSCEVLETALRRSPGILAAQLRDVDVPGP